MTYIGALSGGYSGGGSSANGINQMTYTPGSGLSGLASGIDTDSIVNAMIQAAQVPLVQLLQQRQIMQWQEMRYQQVNASLSDLNNTVLAMKLQSTFMAHQVSSSNSAVVTGTASTLAPNGTYSITVQQLAQGATVYSSSRLSTDPNWATNTTLSNLGYPDGVTLTINGQSITLGGSTTVASALTAITSNTKTEVAAFYDSASGKVIMQTTSTGAGAKIQVDDATQSFLSTLGIQTAAEVTSTADLSGGLAASAVIIINGVRIPLNGTPSSPLPLSAPVGSDSIEAEINKYSAQTGVTATDDGMGHLVLQPSYIDGDGKQWDLLSPISVTTEDPSNVLGLADPYAGTPTDSQVARDAVFTINGYTTTSSTNQANYNGLTLNLLSTTSSPVTVSVSTDVDAIVNTITNFVQQYNQTLQLMQGLYNEQRNYDYAPLTQQQASQMTQDQIEKWYQKAQSGVLANDSLLGSIMSTLQSDMSMRVSGQATSTVNGQNVTLNSLAAIGITPIDPMTGVSAGAIAPGVTTSGWNSYGLLQIDTDKLRAALQADPQAVMRLFTNDPSIGGNPSMGTGIAVQLSNDLYDKIQQLTDEAGSNPDINSQIITKFSNGTSVGGAGLLPYTPIDPNADLSTLFGTDPLNISFLGEQIQDMDTRADDMQQQISDLRQRYLNEFSQMEQAIAQLSSQSGFLAGLLSSSQGG
jgi:flagellar hook-associated protein 2